MRTIKYGSTGEDVMYLCQLLGIRREDVFDKTLEQIVINYQKEKGLQQAYGTVDYETWESLMLDYRILHYPTTDVIDLDYTLYSKLFDCKPRILSTIVETCSNGSGFLSKGKPRIFFEASVFWKNLEKLGLRPDRYITGNSDILSRDWNKSLYKGGEKEWARLEKASKIDNTSALKSTSWGLFQILGENYKLCECDTLDSFVNSMKKDSRTQFILGMRYIKNTGTYKFLGSLNYAEISKAFIAIPGEISKFASELSDIYDRK